MNTMTISSGSRMTSPEYTPSFEQQTPVLLMPHARPLPTWLPAPITPAVPRCAHAPRKTCLNFRRACGSEFRIERAFMLLLAIVAVAAIAYGFSCLVDLVQHWAVFNSGVGHLIQ